MNCPKEKAWESRFDCFCKRVIRNEARDYFRALNRRADCEVSLECLNGVAPAGLTVYDQYFKEDRQFYICGQRITIESDLLFEALAALPVQERNIILLSYMVGENDREISENLRMKRSTIQYNRVKALRKLQYHMGDC